MSWNISHDGRIECLDDGPELPWFIGPYLDFDDEDQGNAMCKTDKNGNVTSDCGQSVCTGSGNYDRQQTLDDAHYDARWSDHAPLTVTYDWG